MTLKMGYRGAIGVGQESTYGTAVAAADWFESKGPGLKGQQEKMIIADTINGGATRNKLVLGRKTVEGNINFPVIPDSCIGQVLMSFCNAGPVSEQQGTTTAYKHTFLGSAAAAIAAKTSLTIQQIFDDYCHDFTGCVANNINLTVSSGGMLDMNVGFVGKDWAVQASPGTPAITTSLPLTYAQVCVAQDSTPIYVRSANITLANGVIANDAELCSYTTRQMQRGMYVVNGSMEMYFESTAQYDAFINNTTHELKLTAEGATISGAYKQSLILTLGKIYIVQNPLPDLGNKEAFVQTVNFEALYDDATDQDFKFELINTTTSYA